MPVRRPAGPLAPVPFSCMLRTGGSISYIIGYKPILPPQDGAERWRYAAGRVCANPWSRVYAWDESLGTDACQAHLMSKDPIEHGLPPSRSVRARERK